MPNDILLIEDNPDDERLILRALLKNRVANQINVVRDGAEALDYLFCSGEYADRDIYGLPKLILLDLKLPKVDGIEVLRQIRANDRTKLIPVLILTSSREEQDLIDCYSYGANSYIVKPIDFEQFNETMGQLGLYWLLINENPPDWRK
ncbi:response regulator [Candidatus Latescibacterota bacterium]